MSKPHYVYCKAFTLLTRIGYLHHITKIALSFITVISYPSYNDVYTYLRINLPIYFFVMGRANNGYGQMIELLIEVGENVLGSPPTPLGQRRPS